MTPRLAWYPVGKRRAAGRPRKVGDLLLERPVLGEVAGDEAGGAGPEAGAEGGGVWAACDEARGGRPDRGSRSSRS